MGVSANTAGQPGAAAAKVKAELVVSSVGASNFWSTFRMAVLSAPGKGKTVHFCTASKHCAGGWPPPSGTFLDDILLVELDSGGSHVIRQHGLDAHVIDLSAFTDEDLFNVIGELPEFILNKARALGVRAICIDTASNLMRGVNIALARKHEGVRQYLELASMMRRFMWRMREINVPVIYNCHIKDPQIIMRDKASGTLGDPEGTALAAGGELGMIFMDIAGKDAAKAIRDGSDLVGFLTATDLPGGKVLRQMSFDHNKVETKNRLSNIVPNLIPSDLGALLRSIGTAVNSPLY